MAELLLMCIVMLSMVWWVIIFIGMGIFRFLGKCPYTCFNTKCPWKYFCKRFVTLAYSIEHTHQMLVKAQKNDKRAQMLTGSDETNETDEANKAQESKKSMESDKSGDDA